MSLTTKLLVATGLIAILVVAAGTDMFLTRDTPFPLTEEQGDMIAQGTGSVATGPKYEHVPDVLETLTLLNFEFQMPTETYFIQSIVSPGEELGSRVLLKNGDRVGLIAWVRSPLSKVYFRALKEALHESFSPDVSDLVDEVQETPGKQKRSILTFIDPALSEERLVYVQTRDYLFEFHITKGKEDDVFALIEELTQ